MIDVIKVTDGWELCGYGSFCGADYLAALDAFAANWPDLADELDGLAADYRELVGEPTVAREPVSRTGTRSPKRGSGARFRELIAGGASNAEALSVVRSEFPESKATLSDAAWNRAKLLKEGGSITKKGSPGGEPLSGADDLL